MPLNDYHCFSCDWEKEIITTKISDVEAYVECPNCGAMAEKLMGACHLRFRKLFTAGGPNVEDKDGFESLGMTGEQAQESEKKHFDHKQLMEKEGMSPFDAAVKMSPSREMTDEEARIARDEKERAGHAIIQAGSEE